jgi:dTDP-4-amino-4,6-dideoxygalactose transaminase
MRSVATFTPRHYAECLNCPGETLMDCQDALTKWTGRRYCILCSSGSAALYMALVASGVSKIAIPAFTFPAIIEACKLARVVPVIRDVNPDTWHTDFGMEDVTSPVWNYGTVSPHPHRARTCIVDAAAALLTPGAFVDPDPIYCVSSNWNKSISGGGGGCILTDDAKIADASEGLKRHRGSSAFNFQMPAQCASEVFNQLQAAELRQSHLRMLSEEYDYQLARNQLMAFPKGICRWLTGTVLKDENAVLCALAKLDDYGFCGRRTWMPLGDSSTCPNAWDIYRRGVILPGGYDINAQDVEQVCQLVGGVRRVV